VHGVQKARPERADRGIFAGLRGGRALEFLVSKGDVEGADGQAFFGSLETIAVDDVEVIDDLNSGRFARLRQMAEAWR
jgi:hypothetical protein